MSSKGVSVRLRHQQDVHQLWPPPTRIFLISSCPTSLSLPKCAFLTFQGCFWRFNVPSWELIWTGVQLGDSSLWFQSCRNVSCLDLRKVPDCWCEVSSSVRCLQHILEDSWGSCSFMKLFRTGHQHCDQKNSETKENIQQNHTTHL